MRYAIFALCISVLPFLDPPASTYHVGYDSGSFDDDYTDSSVETEPSHD